MTLRFAKLEDVEDWVRGRVSGISHKVDCVAVALAVSSWAPVWGADGTLLAASGFVVGAAYEPAESHHFWNAVRANGGVLPESDSRKVDISISASVQFRRELTVDQLIEMRVLPEVARAWDHDYLEDHIMREFGEEDDPVGTFGGEKEMEISFDYIEQFSAIVRP